MIDPLSAMTAAGLAFSTFKKVIGTAKDVESISKTLGDWYGACADVNANKPAIRATIFNCFIVSPVIFI